VCLGLLALGVQKGDRVGIWAPNRCEWVVVQYATARIGAILVNVNPAYQEPELEYVLQQARISVLISCRAVPEHGLRSHCPAGAASLCVPQACCSTGECLGWAVDPE